MVSSQEDVCTFLSFGSLVRLLFVDLAIAGTTVTAFVDNISDLGWVLLRPDHP